MRARPNLLHQQHPRRARLPVAYLSFMKSHKSVQPQNPFTVRTMNCIIAWSWRFYIASRVLYARTARAAMRWLHIAIPIGNRPFSPYPRTAPHVAARTSVLGLLVAHVCIEARDHTTGSLTLSSVDSHRESEARHEGKTDGTRPVATDTHTSQTQSQSHMSHMTHK